MQDADRAPARHDARRTICAGRQIAEVDRVVSCRATDRDIAELSGLESPLALPATAGTMRERDIAPCIDTFQSAMSMRKCARTSAPV
jgi:hypothetical protein